MASNQGVTLHLVVILVDIQSPSCIQECVVHRQNFYLGDTTRQVAQLRTSSNQFKCRGDTAAGIGLKSPSMCLQRKYRQNLSAPDWYRCQ